MLGVQWGRVVAVVAAAGVVGVGTVAIRGGGPDTPTATGPASSVNCTAGLEATNATQLATAVSNATTGQTVCLAATADFGTWTGTSKAITIGAKDGFNPTIALDLNTGDSSFTIDGNRTTWTDSTGLTITDAGFSGTPGPQNVTIKNTAFTNNNASGSGGLVEISGPTNTADVFDHDIFYAIGGDNAGTCQPSDVNYPSSCQEAAIRFSYDGPSGMTIQNSLFHDMAADAVKVGASNTTIQNNEFYAVKPDNAAKHTDAIQLCCGYISSSNAGSGAITITGNFVNDCEQGIGAFDGTGSDTIKHNVVNNCTAHQLITAGDSPASTVSFNTIAFGAGSTSAAVECGSKPANVASVTAISNNITPQGVNTAGIASPPGPDCTPSSNTHNMFTSGASSPNLNGTAAFVGGSSPTSFAGFCLTAGSAGHAAATDGTDVGACGEGFTGGPPETYP